jgi:hypothetical protein
MGGIEMCGGGRPAPAQPVAAPPTFDEIATDDNVKARTRTRKRLAGAVNTSSTLMTDAMQGKTLLGG